MAKNTFYNNFVRSQIADSEICPRTNVLYNNVQRRYMLCYQQKLIPANTVENTYNPTTHMKQVNRSNYLGAYTSIYQKLELCI